MLKLTIPSSEFYDDVKNEFITTEAQTINLEHSLLSISKWESKWCKPFISSQKSSEEILDYIKCMTTTKNVSDDVYLRLSADNIKEINEYIEAPMTATTFSDKKGTNREVVTSELIYYWIISFNIPIECQKWHLNRLLTLIKVCNIKNSPPEKINRQELMRRNKQLNAERRKAIGTNG